MRMRSPIVFIFFIFITLASPLLAGTREDELLRAVRAGDLAAVKALLDQGVPVDTKFRYDRTALSFATDRGNAEIVKLLLERGADAGAKDSFYHMTPLGSASYKGHVEVVKLLLARQPASAGEVLLSAVRQKSVPLLEAALETGKLSAYDLSYSLEAAEKETATDVAARLKKAGAVPPPAANVTVDAPTLARYAGRYRGDESKDEFTLGVNEGALTATFGGRTFKLGAFDARRFKHLEATGVTLEMELEGERVVGAKVKEIGSEEHYTRVEDTKP
jgi:hypothetical protein